MPKDPIPGYPEEHESDAWWNPQHISGILNPSMRSDHNSYAHAPNILRVERAHHPETWEGSTQLSSQGNILESQQFTSSTSGNDQHTYAPSIVMGSMASANGDHSHGISELNPAQVQSLLDWWQLQGLLNASSAAPTPSPISSVGTAIQPASWIPFVNPGPFTYIEVMDQIDPLFCAGQMRDGARMDLRDLYHLRTYPSIDLVKREQGGSYGIKVFRRVYDTEVHIKVDKRVRFAAEECLIQVFECVENGAGALTWQQLFAGRKGEIALACQGVWRTEQFQLEGGVKLCLGSGRNHVRYTKDQKHTILICRIVFPDCTYRWTTMFSIDGKAVKFDLGSTGTDGEVGLDDAQLRTSGYARVQD